jgi:hypothetical protein
MDQTPMHKSKMFDGTDSLFLPRLCAVIWTDYSVGSVREDRASVVDCL